MIMLNDLLEITFKESYEILKYQLKSKVHLFWLTRIYTMLIYYKSVLFIQTVNQSLHRVLVFEISH